MRTITLTALVLSSRIVFAGAVDCGEIPCHAKAPTFEQYAVTKLFAGTPSRVDLSSHPRARRFRSNLSTGAEKGPNFAGRYTVVTWGCGVACQELAIVDSRTGKVHFPSNLRLNAYHDVHDDPMPEPFQFQLNSSLFVIVGSPNDTSSQGLFFYSWDGRSLLLLYHEPREWK